MGFKSTCNQTNSRRRYAALTVLVLSLITGCSEPGADPVTNPQMIFEENRKDILQCTQVCEIQGWYFTSVSLKASSSSHRMIEKGRLEAAARILTFIEDKERYELIYGNSRQRKSPLNIQKNLTGKLQMRVVASGATHSSTEPQFGITVAARESTNYYN